MEDTLSKFMGESAKRHEENSNLIKEIRASTDVAIRNQGASIKTLEIQICRLNGYYHDGKKGSYGLQFLKAYSKASQIDESIPQMEKDPGSELAHTKLTVELANRIVKYPKGIAENILVRIGKFTFLVDFIILDIPEDIKVPLILRRPFLFTAHVKIDVYKRKITLRVGEENINIKSVKSASSLIKRVYMLSLRERMELDLEARLIGETLVLNKSLDPFLEDYIELNDINEPFELRRNQGDDLMATIKEGEVIKEFITRDKDLDTGIDDYPSYYDDDKKIHIDYMNAYRGEGMGDVIVGEPFLREVGIKARWFDGMITIYNGNDEVTYQMVRSHLRFKHHTNEQFNKIPPLLKVSEHDKMNGISHSYQKSKRFYKGVLNLGPDFIRVPSMEEWLTSGHVSVHEME
ncbi:putative ribonuclease H-like domain-containing protein [Tanacetum coccineum]